MIETIKFNCKDYPKLTSEGFAAQYAFPFAKKLLKGYGVDVGCMKREWAYPGAIPIDLSFNNGYDAMNLPGDLLDYIFSSHCLEHIPDWVGVLDYWRTKLAYGGILYLYLPSNAQGYWLPWNNRKHIHSFTPEVIRNYLEDRRFRNIYVTPGHDLNYSFTAIAEK